GVVPPGAGGGGGGSGGGGDGKGDEGAAEERRTALSQMLDEDPSERRRKCDRDECEQMATHGFILPRLCGQHSEARMLRIVPADVESGDEWGSDTEADARDYGRFRRIAGADPETIQNALKLYPPRNPETRARIYDGLGLELPGAVSRRRSSSTGGGGGGDNGGGSGRSAGAAGSSISSG
ncbi:unnamed protein product, partial [Ectocarpus sp. 4 AP-2014]